MAAPASNAGGPDGEVTEWSKVRAWRARVPLVGTVGSNPTLSAIGFGERTRS